MTILPAVLTVLPGDRPFAGRCSRCNTQDLGLRQVSGPWNGAVFLYCADCRAKMEAEEARRQNGAVQ